MRLRTYSESTPKELSNGMLTLRIAERLLTLRIEERYGCKLVLPVHFSVEKLCHVTCHMITLNACPSSFAYSCTCTHTPQTPQLLCASGPYETQWLIVCLRYTLLMMANKPETAIQG